MLMIPARLGRSESFWAVAKVRSPHTGPGIRYIIVRAPLIASQRSLALQTSPLRPSHASRVRLTC